MKSERAINIAKGCVMASLMDSETKQMVIEALNQVDISKTETTTCEWCKGVVGEYFDVLWYDFINRKRGSVNYCPNCGRRLEEKNHGSKENN